MVNWPQLSGAGCLQMNIISIKYSEAACRVTVKHTKFVEMLIFGWHGEAAGCVILIQARVRSLDIGSHLISLAAR